MSTVTKISAACLFALTAVACDTETQVFEHTTQPGSVLIREVQVNLNSGVVQATGAQNSDGSPVLQVKSTATARWYGEDPTVEFVQEADVLKITALCRQADRCEVDLAISMPVGASLTVDGEQTDVMVTGLDGSTTVETGQGSIELSKLGGDFDVSAQDGAITGTDLASMRGTAATLDGAITLEFVSKYIFKVMADTVRGDISLTVPNLKYTVEAKTNEGEVDVDVFHAGLSRRLIHAIATESGDISVQPDHFTAQ